MNKDKDKAEADKSVVQRDGSRLPPALKFLFADPPLIEGENPADFSGLFEALAEELEPQNVMDWFKVYDVTVKRWEQARLRRWSAEFVQAGMSSSVQYHMKQITPPDESDFLPRLRPDTSAWKAALKYFSNKPRERSKVVAQLAQHKISLAGLQANSVVMNAEHVQMFERMIEARENGLRRLRKDVRKNLDERRSQSGG